MGKHERPLRVDSVSSVLSGVDTQIGSADYLFI